MYGRESRKIKPLKLIEIIEILLINTTFRQQYVGEVLLVQLY